MDLGESNALAPTLSAAPSHAHLEFQVLGPVEALKDGVPVRLGGPKQRSVLALLLAEAGRTISADRLIDLLWGDEPSSGARSTLQTYLSNLRSEIGELVVRDGGGYRLEAKRDQVDAFRFEDEVARVRNLKDSQPLEAAQRLRDALALWRGHPYADISGSVVLDQEARRLEELRLAAIEERLEAELALANHAEVVGELEVLTTEHPFRERFRALHMLSLYRSGRQAEALHVYRKTRTFLAEELGIDPSPALRDMEAKILRQDPSLLLETEPRVETMVFLLADIEDSTVLWELHPREMGPAAGEYDRVIAEAVEAAGGRVVKRVGDGLDAVFSDVGSAVGAAQKAQRALAWVEWGATGPLKARMAIDLGDVEARGSDYFGPMLNRCGRILAAGHGGQVLLSADAHAALSRSGAGWGVRALGEFRFKGLGRPQLVFQLLVDGLPSEFPPLRIDRLPPFPRTSFEKIVRGYELREQVGGGEFGVVYRAYQPSVGREVAIKVIRPEFVNQPAFVRRFEVEAQLIAQLEYPHIVALYDFWRDPEGAYLVMRWLRGGALRDALDRGPWNVEPASRLLQQIGSALSYAHRQGAVHGDLKPANVLLDEEGNAYLSDFAVASRLVDASEAGRPITSTPAYVPPEELRGEPLRPAADIFALGLLTFELLSGRRPPMDRSLPAIAELRPDLPGGIGPVIARATAEEPAGRFASVEEFLGALFEALGEARVHEEPAFTPTRNPYKGLHAFSELDAQDFFGRDAFTEELVHAVKDNRLVAVVGPSGIGKSSVVRAGLIPALRAGAISGSREWVFTDMLPGSYPFEELEAALLRVAVERPENLTEDLARDDRGILRVTKRILPPDSQALLLVDQFEELFTLTANEETRRLFLDALTTLALDGRSRVRMVITLRADFFDRPLRYPRFGDLLREGLVAVTAPSEADLGQAITRPGEGVGVQFEPGLVSRIIADVNDQPGVLPLLQYALTELFAARTSDLLTVHGYQATGGVLGALGRRAEELFQGLDTQGQEAARQVFLRLVAVSDVAEDARRRVRRQELSGLGFDPELLEDVLRRFGEYRLLSFDRDPLTRGPTVEVAHEALLSEWKRLRTWISERREDLLLERRLSEAVEEWDQAGKDPSYLLTGGRLHQFATWAAKTDLALTVAERDYIQQGRDADALRRVRVRRRRRSILGGFAAAAFVSLALAGLAYLNQRHARESEVTSDAQRIGTLALTEQSLDRSFLLAVLGLRLQDLPETRSDLLAVLQKTPGLFRFIRPSQTKVSDLAVDPDGRVFAIGDTNGVVRFYDLRTWKPTETVVQLEPVSSRSMAFSPDGRELAVGTLKGNRSKLYLVDVSSGAARLIGSWASVSASDTEPGTTRVAFAPDGTRIAAAVVTAQEEGGWRPRSVRLLLIDASTGRVLWGRRYPLSPKQRKEGSPARNVQVAFTPRGALLTSMSLGDTIVWDPSDGRIVRRFPVGGWFDISPDGHLVAIALNNADGFDQRASLAVLDLRTGRHRELDPLLFSTWITDVEFAPDGAQIVGRSFEGGVHVWDVASGSIVRSFTGHGPGLSLAVDPHGDTVFSGADDGTVAAWGLTGTHRLDQGFRLRPRGMLCPDAPCFVFNPTGTLLAESLWDGKVAVVDLRTRRRVATLPARNGSPASALAFFPDGRTLATGGVNGNVTLWDVASWSVAETLRFADPVQWVAVSPDGQLLAAQTQTEGGTDSRVEVRSVPSGETLYSHVVRYGAGGLYFSPDGRELAALGCCESGSTIEVWDVRSGADLFSPRLDAQATSIAFSYDGRVLGAGTADGKIVLWDAHDGRQIGSPLVVGGATSDIFQISFSPDGRLLGVSSGDGTTTLWDLRSRKRLGNTFPVDAAWVTDSYISPSGEFVIDNEWDTALWPTDLRTWIDFACKVAGRDLTRAEWADLLPNRPYQHVCPG
jgi:WD40 repeat protein/serine/threonine protein kinase/DNA-binding SARP family transcriptional activator